MKVLIVEDNDGMRRALHRSLVSRGYDVTSIGNVQDALQAVDGNERVLLDLNMPGQPGTDLLVAMRKMRHPARVLVMTGASFDSQIVCDARKLKPDRIIKKPFELSQILEWLTDENSPPTFPIAAVPLMR